MSHHCIPFDALRILLKYIYVTFNFFIFYIGLKCHWAKVKEKGLEYVLIFLNLYQIVTFRFTDYNDQLF